MKFFNDFASANLLFLVYAFLCSEIYVLTHLGFGEIGAGAIVIAAAILLQRKMK